MGPDRARGGVLHDSAVLCCALLDSAEQLLLSFIRSVREEDIEAFRHNEDWSFRDLSCLTKVRVEAARALVEWLRRRALRLLEAWSPSPSLCDSLENAY